MGMSGLFRTFLALAATLAGADSALAQSPVVPAYWDSRDRLVRPDMSTVPRLRFLATTSFAPFSYLDAAGGLAGFNVDLARAICSELAVEDRCQIQALPWDALEPSLAAGGGDAIIAGVAVKAAGREAMDFSRVYLQLPGRFVMRRAGAFDEPMHANLRGKRVGVAAGSAHERILRDLFPAVSVVTYGRDEWMLDDLREGRTDAVFGDGMRLSFWIGGSASRSCCRFAGGPYILPDYLGEGMAIAVRREDRDLLAAIDFALQQVGVKGIFTELYLRYFPVGFY